MSSAKNEAARSLPSVDELLRSSTGCEIIAETGAKHAADLARAAIGAVRKTSSTTSKTETLASCEANLTEIWKLEKMRGQKRVINATGVIVHTNLGRAPLSDAVRNALIEASGACTLEYDLETGKRGKRGRRVEELIVELTGAEDAVVVNNCAAAAFFVLTVFASGGEAIISRGELVEIGGDFRVPDVLTMSGATLREVGTTNRTKIADYEKAIGDKTNLLLRVHPSNYRIIGFTATPSVAELAVLAKKHALIFYEDIGSGALVDLSDYGLTDEPVVGDSIAAGANLVTFSGDKLLGGPQSGIIAGRKELIEKLRKHPLYRALRPDKLTLAALQATLLSYTRGKQFEEIPVMRQLAMTAEEIKRRAEDFVANLPANGAIEINLVADGSVIGGGAAPDVRRPTVVIAIKHKTLSAENVERKFRMFEPPIITRIENQAVLIDLRTVSFDDESVIASAINSLN